MLEDKEVMQGDPQTVPNPAMPMPEEAAAHQDAAEYMSDVAVYQQRLHGVLEMLEVVAHEDNVVPGKFLLRLVMGSNRVPQEQFDLFHELVKGTGRFTSIGGFTYKMVTQTEHDTYGEVQVWDGVVDGIDLRSVVDEIVTMMQQPTERQVEFKELLGRVRQVCGTTLNNTQFAFFEYLVGKHPSVQPGRKNNEFTLSPHAVDEVAPHNATPKDMYSGGPVSSETVHEADSLEEMLRIIRRASNVPTRRQFTRRRLHYKRGTNMDDSQ